MNSVNIAYRLVKRMLNNTRARKKKGRYQKKERVRISIVRSGTMVMIGPVWTIRIVQVGFEPMASCL